MNEKILVKHVVYDYEQFDKGSPPENLIEFQSWLNYLLHSIPDEYRQSAEIDIDSTASYDSSLYQIGIYYFRPETDEEYQQRIVKNICIKNDDLNRKKALLARMKAELVDQL